MGLTVVLPDGSSREATEAELAAFATAQRRMASPRGVVLEERARAARDRHQIATLLTRCAELERRVHELELELAHHHAGA